MVHVILFSAIGISFLAKKRGKFAQSIPFIILFFFAAFRYMYGNDYSNYYQNFYLIKLGGTEYDDAWFVWLNQIFPNFFSLIAFTSFCFVATVYWAITKNVPKEYICIGLSIFVISPYLFLMNLSAIRQCLAMLLFVVAVYFSHKKHYILYFICIMAATQFHASAIILLPFVLLANEKPFTNKHIVTFLGILAVLLTIDSFSSIIENLASQFDNENYLHYATNDLTNSVRATILSGVSMVYVLINLPELKGAALMYGKLYLLSPTIAVLAIRMSTLTRIQMYFDIFAVIALPLIFIHNLKKGKVEIDRKQMGVTILEIAKRYVLPALIVIIYLLRYYSFFNNPMWKSFFEYQTIFGANVY